MRQNECVQYLQQIYPILSTQKQLKQKTVFSADQHQFYYHLYMKYTNDPLNVSQIQEDSQDKDVQMSYLDPEEQYLDADLYGFKYLLLTTLHIQNVNLCNLNSLSCLMNLRQLNVSQNGIVDITPVQYLINLKFLDFSFNRVVDISVLRFLTSLTHIAMISNNIVDVFPLSYLRNLRELYATFNRIMFVSPLMNLNLRVIELSNNYLIDAYLLDNKQQNQKLIYSQKIIQLDTKRNSAGVTHLDKQRQIPSVASHELINVQNSTETSNTVKTDYNTHSKADNFRQLFIPRGVLRFCCNNQKSKNNKQFAAVHHSRELNIKLFQREKRFQNCFKIKKQLFENNLRNENGKINLSIFILAELLRKGKLERSELEFNKYYLLFISLLSEIYFIKYNIKLNLHLLNASRRHQRTARLSKAKQRLSHTVFALSKRAQSVIYTHSVKTQQGPH
ncbi:leucine-rich_repeat domain-containing protein [Hexamita inflata]|uniref:Leucine-rich repeat domain-containing protein n=1 Tax=Hexamita inflata TaxID=28002 RepID=A0AA86UTA6_9EUKA|nr:leucine-rich repeat domain-containing protein [Hexamita inflata]